MVREAKSQSLALFEKQYVSVDARKNFPLANGQNYLRAGAYSLGVSYLHVLSEDWIVGVSLAYKDFRARKDDESIAFIEVSNQAQYIIRLHYPIYLLLGSKWLYLSATKGLALPPEKTEEFNSEIGVALSANLIWRLSSEWLLNARVDRWRGTASNRLHGLELGFGVAHRLK